MNFFSAQQSELELAKSSVFSNKIDNFLKVYDSPNYCNIFDSRASFRSSIFEKGHD